MADIPSIVFGGNVLDRTVDRSDDGALRALYRDGNSRVLPFCNLNPAVRDKRLDLVETAALPISGDDDPGVIFLGMQGRRALFTVAVSEETGPWHFGDARGMATVLPSDETGIVAQARTLHHWHACNRFCANCGHHSHAVNGGAARGCSFCGVQHFPKLEPAVIMLIIDGDRCLLGRQASWPPGRYSTLAGFVEAGETIETAVRRETLEEAGIVVGQVSYAFSQPWPFPASLMLGFFAEARSTEIKRNDKELDDALWLNRAEAALLVERGEAGEVLERHLPGAVSLGHQLVKAWVSGKMPQGFSA